MPSSFQKYEAEYRLRIKDSNLRNIAMKDLKSRHLQLFFNSIQENYPFPTLKRTYSIVKQCISFAIENEDIFRNPMRSVTIPERDTKPKKRSMPMTSEQQILFVNALENSVLDNLIYLALATGGRIAELIALTWDDFTGDSIQITKQYRKSARIEKDGSKKWVREISVPKSDTSIREIPITEATRQVLLREKKIIEEMKSNFGEKFEDHSLIFCDEYGNYIESKRPTRKVQSICKTIGLPPFTFHELRHSYATRLYEQGVPIRTIQLLLGHYDIRSTEIYVTVLEDSKKSAIDLLDGII